jgi:Single Cache domain 2
MLSGARYLSPATAGSNKGEKSMIRTFMIAAASAAVLTISPTLFGQQPDHGTAAQAKAMLLKAEAAVKADKTKALDMFNAGEGGFRDRDLYVFCANISDGKIVAQGNPNAKQLLGQDERTIKDSTGKNFGQELYAAGKKPEGKITKVSYMFVRPGGDTTPVPKVSLVTRVSDLVCGVGYYK